MPWVIEDWTGRNVYPGRTFSTFEDGWAFITAQHPDEDDWQEFYVVEAAN